MFAVITHAGDRNGPPGQPFLPLPFPLPFGFFGAGGSFTTGTELEGGGGGELIGGDVGGTAVLVLIGCGDCVVDDGSSASASVPTISATNAAAASSSFRPRLMGLRRADGTK